MASVESTLDYIDELSARFLDRPEMYAPSAAALENVCMLLEDIREHLLTGRPVSKSQLNPYVRFLIERGYQSSNFTSHNNNSVLTDEELLRFREFAVFWKEFLTSQARRTTPSSGELQMPP